MKKAVLFIFFLLFQAINYAQGEATVDLAMPYYTLNGIVESVAQQADGKIIIGGSFTSTNNLTKNRITRLNTDGSVDTNFNVGTAFGVSGGASVSAIQVQTDGKILVGGTFTTFNGLPCPTIIRLNTDGTKDTSFVPASSFDGGVYAIAVQSDGTIFVGGSNAGTGKLAKLNSNGSLNASFGEDSNFNSTVRAIAVQTDGKVVVGGAFITYSGLNQKYIARFSSTGVRESTYNPTDFNGTILNLKVLSSGKILVGGNFTLFGATSQNRICRLNADATGTLDETFNIGTAFDNRVEKMEVQTDGKIIAVGNFTTFNGSTRSKITRLNSNGTIDNTFAVGTGFDATAYNVCVQTDGKVIAVGSFTSYNGSQQDYITRMNTNGTKDVAFKYHKGFNNSASTMAKQTDGKIIVGGGFTTHDGISSNYLSRMNSDATKDINFNVGTGFSSSVYSVAIQTDGKIVVGGSFTTYNGTTTNRIVRLNTDGSLDPAFSVGTGFNNAVEEIVIQPNGKILVGGTFTSYNGTTRNRIIRLNTDGSIDGTFTMGSGFAGTVMAIALQADGKILVGGNFSTFNGIASSQIARLNSDGTLDNTFVVGTGFDNSVYDIAVQTDGKILVGGQFTSYNGGPMDSSYFTRLNTDGSLDTNSNMGYGIEGSIAPIYVGTIAIQADGKILLGGKFDLWDGIPDNKYNLIRLNTNLSRDDIFDVGIGFDNTVYNLLIDDNNKIWVGGLFKNYDGTPTYNAVRLNPGVLSRNGFIKNDLVKVYPNPVSDVLTVTLPNNINVEAWEVFDLAGKKVQEENSKINSINVSKLQSGIYFLKLKTTSGTAVKEFIKQ